MLKKPKKKVGEPEKLILKKLAQANQVIEGHLFHIKDYVFEKGIPVVVVECNYRRHPKADSSYIPCPVTTRIHLNGDIDQVVNEHNHPQDPNLVEERSFHKDVKKLAQNIGVTMRKNFDDALQRYN
ncbi:uncharacterized protein LOC123270851 [Cotesia glomerata]|uniref:uncharacterized protein LOC123270851 n=1 Tax=Cotesia glomerata TaxID=32391 RepID=UPI001D034B6D|nr:uncharacterized protein LOC123270851 [Cotesia glomerata]